MPQERLSKFIASFNYFDKSLIFLSETSGSISIASFATAIRALVGIASASFSLAFLISPGLVKATRTKKKKHKKIVMLAKSKLNSIESKTLKVLINNEISYEDFMTIIYEERNYSELKKSIRIMKSQRIDEIINNNLKSQI